VRQAAPEAHSTRAQKAPPADSLEVFMGKVRASSERARPASRVQTVEAQDAAVAAALLAVAVRPSAAGHRAVAREYIRIGILDVAHEHLSAAVALDPRDAAAWDGLARIWRDWGFPHLALADAHRARYFAPSSPVVHNTLGTVLQALGHRADARAQYEKALALDTNAAYALTNLCYGWVLEGEAMKAADACRQALRLQPGSDAARNNLALAYDAAGDSFAAFATFASTGDEGRTEYNTGLVHLARRRYPEALKAFEAAQALRPRFRTAEAMARYTRKQLIEETQR
jgi:Flp pilus assembly protein TadD